MPLSAADKLRVARIVARKWAQAHTASLTHADILAAVTPVDNAMDGLPNALPNQAVSVITNLNLVLPEPFKSTADTELKAYLLATWAGVRYGVIPTGGE